MNELDPHQHKRGLQRQFDRSANIYAQEATLQSGLAHRLMSLAPSAPPQRILDAGAGSGFAGAAMQQRFPHSELYALDLAPSMLRALRTTRTGINITNPTGQDSKNDPDLYVGNAAPPKMHAVCGDLEQLPFAPRSFDLVISSAALHWCPDWRRALQNMCATLRPQCPQYPHGHLLLAAFCFGTLQELDFCWQDSSKCRHIMEYPSPYEILQTLISCGLRIEQWQQQHEVVLYPDALALFTALKRLGTANQNPKRQVGLTSKSHLDAVLRRYNQRYRVHDQVDQDSQENPISPVRATYEVILLRACRVDAGSASDTNQTSPPTNIPGSPS